ncbi:MAG TPA: protein-L-isoaspartate(D-aspartate) O-methyltransferase [Methanomassiliicoccales archaeon]|nr:protein-L-isoaspartate(D-aspartate) O-methyltransferase [Methanomassiliicoccales archaeon]
MGFDQARRDMVERLQDMGVLTDEDVKAAMLKVPRHLFLPSGDRPSAYIDRPMGIGQGQTISAPHMVAIMAQYMKLEPGMNVLEVGAGSGYHAAVLAELVRPGGRVHAMERIPELVDIARENLCQAGYDDTVGVILGDGTEGLPSKAPFHRISVAAAGPEIPRPLLEQLTDGGILIVPVGGKNGQDLIMIEREGEKFRRTDLGPVIFVPLIGKHGY